MFYQASQWKPGRGGYPLYLSIYMHIWCCNCKLKLLKLISSNRARLMFPFPPFESHGQWRQAWPGLNQTRNATIANDALINTALQTMDAPEAV